MTSQSSDPATSRRFTPNLSNCRSRKNSQDIRPRADSNSSSEELSTFCLKNQDYYFAKPPELRKHSRSQDQPILSKNSEYYFRPGTVCEEMAMEEDDYWEQAKEIAWQHGGVCLSSTCENPHFSLVYRCRMGHVWESAEVLLSGQWCWECSQGLEKAKIFAESNGGECLNEEMDLMLEFRCAWGHQWRADYSKFQSQKWCQQCNCTSRISKKQQRLLEQQKIEEEQAKLQEELFKEARKQMERSLDMEHAKSLVMEEQIENDARVMTEMFMVGTHSGDCSYEQALSIYKILCAPENYVYSKYFSKNLGEGNANSAYRQLAKLLHPDKNKHPLAGEAFLKVCNVFSTVNFSQTS